MLLDGRVTPGQEVVADVSDGRLAFEAQDRHTAAR
jgi:hypothetical protein